MLTKCEACQHEISAEATSCPQCGHPVKPPAKKGGIGCLGFGLIAIAGLFVFALIMPKNGADSSATPSPPSADSILDDASFQASNPKFTGGIRALITSEGFECPALTQLWNRGQSPYGLKLEALCGPDDGKRSAYPNLHYTVYPTRLKVTLCKPFGILAGGCD